jgi:predicted small lipoprotein YifL
MASRDPSRYRWRRILVALAAIAAFGACGRKGDLVPPPPEPEAAPPPEQPEAAPG